MKRTLRISTLMLVFAVTMLIWLGFQNPVMADVPSQRLMTSTRPTTGPVVPPANLPPTSGITSKPVTLKSKGLSAPKEMTAKPKAYSRSPRNPGDLVDNWSLEVNNNFEGTVPITASCIVTEGTQYGPRQERRWKEDDTYAYSGAYSIWPARGGNNPLDPATNDYPPALDSWLICGPYDFTNAQYFQVDFHLWVDIPDATPENYDDFVAVVYSLDWDTTHDGSWYGEQYAGNFRQWITQSLSFPNPLRSNHPPLEGQPRVWVGVVFRSDWDTNVGKGAWVDDLKIWRYYKPITTCADVDLGNKGVSVSAYDSISEVKYPIIRAGDVQVVQGLMAAGAHWVRLPILQNNGVFIDTQAYDRMIDTLCNAGISTLPLFNHESITRDMADANSTNSTIAASYRNDFANSARGLAKHLKGRVKYWQIWNEPVGYYPLRDSNYAALLTQTASSIKLADPNAKIVGAGLDHAWIDQNNYLNQVYLQLDREQNGARPFDVLAIHPYNYLLQGYSIDPVGYMHQTGELVVTSGDRTIIDKFVRTMEGNQDSGKKVWISEVGWNSSAGRQNAPTYAVDPIHQAYYLQSGFDILFNEARSVDKVFWYKYMDENVRTNQPTLERIRKGEVWLINHPDLHSVAPSSPSEDVPGWWGLYTTLKLEPKPSRCAFLYHPQRCPDLPWFIYLPLILKSQ